MAGGKERVLRIRVAGGRVYYVTPSGPPPNPRTKLLPRGSRMGYLTLRLRVTIQGKNRSHWLCKCDCGQYALRRAREMNQKSRCTAHCTAPAENEKHRTFHISPNKGTYKPGIRQKWGKPID